MPVPAALQNATGSAGSLLACGHFRQYFGEPGRALAAGIARLRTIHMPTCESLPNQTHLILRSRQGDPGALGELLNRHRAWLKSTAERELNGQVSGRADASDIVQQTLLSAVNLIQQFGGCSSGEFQAWLGRIHERNVQEALRRHVGTRKRSTRLEQRLECPSLADGKLQSPSEFAIRGERVEQVRQHLESLPNDQAEAVRLRHLEGWSLARLAAHFDRSTDSVASLLKRGLEQLRRRIRQQ